MVITTSPLVKTYTLQEFWDLPEPADHSKLELIKGVLYMTPLPGPRHNQAAADLIQQLVTALTRSGCRGQIFVPRAAIWVDDDTYLEPDLMYVSDELKAQVDPKHWTRADIVIEILSPGTEMYVRKAKSDTYRAMGVREKWIVDPESKQIEVRNFEKSVTAIFNAAQKLRSEILPGIEIPLAAYSQQIRKALPRFHAFMGEGIDSKSLHCITRICRSRRFCHPLSRRIPSRHTERHNPKSRLVDISRLRTCGLKQSSPRSMVSRFPRLFCFNQLLDKAGKRTLGEEIRCQR